MVLGIIRIRFTRRLKKASYPKLMPAKIHPITKFKGATKGYVYKLDKKGLGYIRIKSQRLVARVVLIGVPGPRAMIKRKRRRRRRKTDIRS